MIAGDTLFAYRTEANNLCNYVARISENRGRGLVICEGQPRQGFAIRFRAPEDRRPVREVPPDEDLLPEEQRRRPEQRFEFRGLEELFGR
jgi:hypothetical protein